MKLLPITISFFVLTLSLLSCHHTIPGTLNYGRLIYDTNRIAIFNWDMTKTPFPNNSDPLPLTQQDLALIDSLLKDGIDSFNTNMGPGLHRAFAGKVPIDSFVINLEKYKYQYFPFKDVNGQRVVRIIGFSTNFQSWKKEVYQSGEHYGMRMLELKINLSEKNRGDIRSGDFG